MMDLFRKLGDSYKSFEAVAHMLLYENMLNLFNYIWC